MSFRRMLDRIVTIQPRVVDGVDARGNDVIVDGDPIENVRAARDLTDSEEDTDGGDRQTRTFRYFLEPRTAAGVPVTVSGFDRIIDGPDTFEVRGDNEPEIRRRRRVVHHVEAKVERITG